MRRIITLALLYVGMQMIIPLDTRHGAGAVTLLTFGFLVLGAYTSGELAEQLHLPKITGYLVAGLLFGPGVIGIVSASAVSELAPVSRLAVALIAFLAGLELRWGELKERGRAILTIMSTELVLQFAAIVGVLWLMRGYLPFVHDATAPQVLALCALFAAIAIVHSPAVTMALLTETRARGPVARTTLGIVLVADVVVVLLFSLVLAIVRAMVPAPGGVAAAMSPGVIAWEIGGALVVGSGLGLAVALYMRFVQRELLLFAIVIAFFGAEIARLAHVETLLTLVMAGFITGNATHDQGRELLHAMERSAVPVFVVFFALAGASIDLPQLARLWLPAIAIVGARAAAIFVGSNLGARWSTAPDVVRRDTWLGLISQSGVAIGLAAILASAYSTRGAEMQTLILSVIAINTVAGQILFRVALVRAGEVVVEAGEETGVRERGVGATLEVGGRGPGARG
ncbi:MAG TPA: cation:proton antiporter, partial [Gemmatimonadaceae bacterium]